MTILLSTPPFPGDPASSIGFAMWLVVALLSLIGILIVYIWQNEKHHREQFNGYMKRFVETTEKRLSDLEKAQAVFHSELKAIHDKLRR